MNKVTRGIVVKHDHKLVFPSISVPMYSEDNADPNSMDIKQTVVEGILVPLFRYNNMTITFEMVASMTLRCSTVPTISLTFNDSVGMIKTLDTPGHDNILYLQMLPPHDNTYKKVHLAFYVTNVKIRGSRVTLTGTYYIPGLFNNTMKPYGMLSTYDLFERISNEYSLGFCSNVDGTSDERYIYNPNGTLVGLLDDEIAFAGGENSKQVFTWWIDLWNNINLVDIYKEYTTIMNEDEMQIWVGDNYNDSTGTDDTGANTQIAAFCNHPGMSSSPTYIFDYTPKLNANTGTDINFEVYGMDKKDRYSTLIQDGDANGMPFTKYSYGGEVFGSYDYLTHRATRNFLLDKINEQVIEVTIHSPLIALMKGSHANVWWYDMNNIYMENIDQSDIRSNIPLPDADSIDKTDSYIINKTISGQYLITDVVYRYNAGTWDIKYTLCRSAESIQRVNPPSKETFMK